MMRWASPGGSLSDLIERCTEFILFLCIAVSAEICEAYEAIEAKMVAFIVIPMTTITEARMYSPAELGSIASPITIISVV